MANVKLSQIASGGAINTSTDVIVGVRSGTTDVLLTPTSSAFNALTSGTNTTAAMAVGTGASLAPSGTGTIVATSTTSYVSFYGAKGNTLSKTATGSTTAGSTTFTDSAGTFTSADVGKIICIAGAGYGNVGTVNQNGNIFVSSIANVGGNIQATFSNISGSTFVNGGRFCFLNSNTYTGGLNNVPQGVYYYAGGLSGSTFTFYYDAALTSPVPYSVAGSTGTGTFYYGLVQYQGTISAVNSATNITLSSAAGFSTTNPQYCYGTNDTTAFANALAAIPNGGTLYVGAGNYMVDSTQGLPNVINVGAAAVATYAIPILQSNVIVQGAGQGATIFTRASWNGTVIGANNYLTNLSNIILRDFTVTYATPVATRNDAQYSSLSISFNGSGTNTISNCRIERCTVHDSCAGISIADNCQNVSAFECYVYNTQSNGFQTVSVSGGMWNCGFDTCIGYNTGDSTFADDNITPDTNGQNYGNYCINCTSLSSQDAGIEISCSSGYLLQGFTSRNAHSAGIIVENFAGIALSTQNVIIDGVHIYGAGNGSASYQSEGTTNHQGGIVIWNGTSNNMGNIQISNAQILPDGANITIGPAIGSYVTGSGIINRLQINGVIFDGGQAATQSTGGHVTWSNNAGIDLAGCNHVSIDNVTMNGTYGDAILIESTCTGNIVIGQNISINAPNSSAGASKYALNIQGGSAPSYTPPKVSGVGTLAGLVNYNPASSYTIANTFSTAGGFTNGSISGQSGTGTGALPWTLTTGTVNVVTASSYLNTAASGTAYFLSKHRDIDVSVLTVTAPTAGSQADLLLAVDPASNSSIAIDLYKMNVSLSINGTSTALTNLNNTATANGDTVRAILMGNTLTIYLTHSGTTTQVAQYFIPYIPYLQNSYTGLVLLSTTPTIAQFNVR